LITFSFLEREADTRMTTLEKFNTGLAELEKTHGEKVPVADVRQLVATTFAMIPAATSTAPASSSAAAAGQCDAMTKGKDPKQCSKKATTNAPDGKCYCPQHLRMLCPEAAPAASSTAAAPAAATVAKKSSPKITGGKGALTPTCSHMIGGKNPRQWTSTGKSVGPDGQHYCGTHFKKFEKAGAGGVGVKPDNAGAATKIAAAMTAPAPAMNPELGLAVDQNGICYLNDYEGSGVCVCGLLVSGAVVDTTPEIEKFVEPFGLPVIPPEAREKIRKMTPEERKQYMEVAATA
jgi:hypothetical protein